MYQKFAKYYDSIYQSIKDYRTEAELLKQIIQDRNPENDTNRKQAYIPSLLDIACGTGLHLEWLSKDFNVSGLDNNAAMLEIARQRLPQVPFYLADGLSGRGLYIGSKRSTT